MNNFQNILIEYINRVFDDSNSKDIKKLINLILDTNTPIQHTKNNKNEYRLTLIDVIKNEKYNNLKYLMNEINPQYKSNSKTPIPKTNSKN